MRVPAVGTHPDDLDILFGRTLARFAREGHTVVMCHACNGNLGHTDIGTRTGGRVILFTLESHPEFGTPLQKFKDSSSPEESE